MSIPQTSTGDVFEAVDWLKENTTCDAHAVAADRIEWECSSDRFEEWGIFRLVAERFELSTYSDFDGRGEFVVAIPLAVFDVVARLIDTLTQCCDNWPWHAVRDPDHRLDVAANALDLTREDLEASEDLCDLIERP